jgi:hypothetical protein
MPVFLLAGPVFANEAVVSKAIVKKTLPLRDGFELKSAEGLLSKDAKTQKWVFTADAGISDGKAVVKAGQAIEMLPSSTLEKMTADMEKDLSIPVRLWARVTKYHGKNFLFPTYFVPMSKTAEEQEPKSKPIEDKRDEPATEPQEDSIIPPDIMKKLRPKRVVNLAKLKKMETAAGDMALTNRTGFVAGDEEAKIFRIDALGRNIEDISFELLPCETLEYTERKITENALRQRYKVAGTVTKYKGRYYLLLQRAVRTYSHGNFAR